MQFNHVLFVFIQICDLVQFFVSNISQRNKVGNRRGNTTIETQPCNINQVKFDSVTEEPRFTPNESMAAERHKNSIRHATTHTHTQDMYIKTKFN